MRYLTYRELEQILWACCVVAALFLGLMLGESRCWADASHAGLPGFCALGGEEIVVTDPATNQKKPSPDYRELECRYTNGQTARVAICQHHYETYTSADYPTIWESIKRGWANEMGTWSRERREKYWKFYEGVEINSCGGE